MKSYDQLVVENKILRRKLKIALVYILTEYKTTKKRKRGRKSFPEKTRKLALVAQNFRCRICGCYLDVYEFDHIDGHRSNNHWSNCQVLCPTCHRRKTKKKILEIQRNRCANCGKKSKIYDFDHIDNNSSNNDISNCQALCPNCHAKNKKWVIILFLKNSLFFRCLFIKSFFPFRKCVIILASLLNLAIKPISYPRTQFNN